MIVPPLLLGKVYLLAGLTFCAPPDFTPQAEVAFKPEATVYNYTTPIADLTRMMKVKDVSKPPEGSTYSIGHTMGATTSEITTGYTYEFRRIEDGKGKACLYLRKARVLITYKTTVRAGAELKDYPCLLDVTKKHENRHVFIGQQAITDALPEIRAAVRAAMPKAAPKLPFDVSELKSRSDTVMEKMRKAIQPSLKKMEKEFYRRQAEIDTFQNYKAESGRCPQERLKLGD